MKDTSTALASDGKKMEWARADKTTGARVPADVGTLGPLPLETQSANAEAFQKAVDAFARKLAAKLPDSATLAIDTSRVIFRTLRLPSTDPGEIASMALTQMEKDAPLPMEDMVCTHDVLRSDDTSALVLSACAPTAAVESMAAAAGLVPERVERVDVRVLGLLDVLATTGTLRDEGRKVLLAEEGDTATLAILDAGLPVLIRSLGVLTPSVRNSLLNTIRISLIQTEIEHGSARLTGLIIVSDSPPCIQAATLAAESLDCPSAIVTPGSVPAAAFGNARRSLEGCAFNLFPDVWKTRLEHNRFKRYFRTGLLTGAALWLILIGWLYGWPALLDQRIRSLGGEVDRLAPAEAKVNDIRNRIRIIETYSDRTFSPMEALLEVAVNQPEGIDLASFRYNGPRRQTLVEGRSRMPTLVYDFMDRLKTSPLFGEVKLASGPTLNRSLGLNVFELSIDFQAPGEREIPTP